MSPAPASDDPAATATSLPATATSLPAAPTGAQAATPAATTARPFAAGSPAPVQRQPGSAARCVILTYHYLAAAEPFATQLGALQSGGYQIVPLEQLVQYLKGVSGTTLPGHCLVLTFDDGWRNQFTFARPALLAAHLPATFFVITNYADQKYTAYMTWAMLQALVGDGFDVEDHTRSHPRLDLVGQKSLTALTDEVAGSLQDLEAYIGPTHRIFCYPYGTFDNRVLQVVRQHYDAAVQLAGSGVQRPEERYQLRRVMVEASWPSSRLLAMVHLLDGG